MVKTRRRDSHLSIKQEESKDKIYLDKPLHVTNNTTKNESKIVKNKTRKTESIQKDIGKLKPENTSDSKQVRASAMPITRKKQVITDEQVKELINYIVNDNMSVKGAARKVKMGSTTAFRYYFQYRDDPAHNIPLAKTSTARRTQKVTQNKIQDLIRYIVDEKMNMTQAARKVKMNNGTASKYYRKYVESVDRKTPSLTKPAERVNKRFTQDQVNKLIGYIVDDNMTVQEASKKVNMVVGTAKRYYLKYLEDPDCKIPAPGVSNTTAHRSHTNEQVKKLIGYIVDDGMSILQASVKTNLSNYSAGKYYQQYLADPDHTIPTPETDNSNHGFNASAHVDQIRAFFNYIIIDEESIKQASVKANIAFCTGYKYFKKCLVDAIKEPEIRDNSYSPEKMIKVVEYIQNDNMSVISAARKVELSYKAALKHYNHYLKDPQYRFPPKRQRRYTQEDMDRLIHCIENEKMSIHSASKKINMCDQMAYQFYRAYQKDPDFKMPVSFSNKRTLKQNNFDIYSQMVADIYKKKSLMEPTKEEQEKEAHNTNSSTSYINIKQELFETKEELKLSV